VITGTTSSKNLTIKIIRVFGRELANQRVCPKLKSSRRPFSKVKFLPLKIKKKRNTRALKMCHVSKGGRNNPTPLHKLYRGERVLEISNKSFGNKHKSNNSVDNSS